MSVTFTMRTPTLVDYLRVAANYPERPRQVQVCETHISWVFLTDRFAYKLKKPVTFSFLDYSTLEARHRACLDELRLNRRLAADVYLEVVPIGRTPGGRWTWDVSGSADDWLVKMRRLPEEASLAQRIAQHTCSERELETLANYLADFYRQQPPLTLRPEQVRSRLLGLIAANQAELAEHHAQELARIHQLHQSLAAYVTQHASAFDERVCDGRYVEGHGDLRPEHIYLLKKPAVIDCIEFSADLRRVDILDELCFLGMECDHLGHPAIGERIVNRYMQRTSDRPPSSLGSFYKTYRAVVRAKVWAIRSSQAVGDLRLEYLAAASSYLQQADSYQHDLTERQLIVICGLMGSGKSTLAQALAEPLGAQLLQTDAIRKVLYPTGASELPFGTGIYQEQHRAAVYAEMFRQAAASLDTGQSVILDGAFVAAAQRQAVRNLAVAHGAKLTLIRCHCPRQVALDRLAHRNRRGDSPSDGRGELYDQQAANWEFSDLDRDMLPIDTRIPLVEQQRQSLSALAVTN